MKKALAAFGLLLVACTSPAPYRDDPVLSDPSPIAESSVLLTVQGLGCPLCANNVDLQLMALPGVGSVLVDLSQGFVFVDFAGEPHPSRLQLAQAIHESGFTLVGIEAQ